MVVQALKNGTYLLEGPRKGRIKQAVNGDALKPFIESRYMIPDVGTQRAMEHFRTWIDARQKSS